MRGINRGAVHNVIDLTDKVDVYSGKEFWGWLSGGFDDAQEWVLEGILSALDEAKIHETAKGLLDQFREGVVEKYEEDIREGDTLDWLKLLKKING